MIINQHYLKTYSILPENYDVSEVMPFVDVAEAVWVRPLVGTLLYDELEREVAENDISEENGTLLTKAIWPYLGLCVVYEALPFIWSHASEVGLTLGKSDNSDSATLKDITYVQSHLRKQIEARKEFAVRFLLEHHTSFPLFVYDECACGCREYAEACGCAPKLENPNPLKFVYTTRRIDTDLR